MCCPIWWDSYLCEMRRSRKWIRPIMPRAELCICVCGNQGHLYPRRQTQCQIHWGSFTVLDLFGSALSQECETRNVVYILNERCFSEALYSSFEADLSSQLGIVFIRNIAILGVLHISSIALCSKMRERIVQEGRIIVLICQFAGIEFLARIGWGNISNCKDTGWNFKWTIFISVQWYVHEAWIQSMVDCKNWCCIYRLLLLFNGTVGKSDYSDLSVLENVKNI